MGWYSERATGFQKRRQVRANAPVPLRRRARPVSIAATSTYRVRTATLHICRSPSCCIHISRCTLIACVRYHISGQDWIKRHECWDQVRRLEASLPHGQRRRLSVRYRDLRACAVSGLSIPSLESLQILELFEELVIT